MTDISAHNLLLMDTSLFNHHPWVDDDYYTVECHMDWELFSKNIYISLEEFAVHDKGRTQGEPDWPVHTRLRYPKYEFMNGMFYKIVYTLPRMVLGREKRQLGKLANIKNIVSRELLP